MILTLVAFSSIFFLLALTSLIQLVMCIHAEYLRMKKNASILKACRVTTQKLLYFLVFLASVLRGAYFAAPTIGTIHILRKHFYSTKLNLTPRIFTKTCCFFVKTTVETEEFLLQHYILTKFLCCSLKFLVHKEKCSKNS